MRTCNMSDEDNNYIEISYEDSVTKHAGIMHASHAMIYAPCESLHWNGYKIPALILMQMRFDGLLGFPGGLVDHDGDTPITAVNREIVEEVGPLLGTKNNGPITASDHLFTTYNKNISCVNHFFVLKVKMEKFKEIEKGVMSSQDYGGEVLGIIRPPLYTMSEQSKGLPLFLCNKFAGNARDQLLRGLVHCGIMSENEINKAKQISSDIINGVSVFNDVPIP